MMDVIVPVWGILEFYQSLRPVVFINHSVVINQSPAIVCITDNHIKIIDTITRWEKGELNSNNGNQIIVFVLKCHVSKEVDGICSYTK